MAGNGDTPSTTTHQDVIMTAAGEGTSTLREGRGQDPPGQQPSQRDTALIEQRIATPKATYPQLSGTKRKRHETGNDDDEEFNDTKAPRRSIDPPADHWPMTLPAQPHRDGTNASATGHPSMSTQSSAPATTGTPVFSAAGQRGPWFRPIQQPVITPHEQPLPCLEAPHGQRASAALSYRSEWTQSPSLGDKVGDDEASSSFVLQLPDDWSASAQENLEQDIACIQDQYRVIKVLGVGAFGCVLLARSTTTAAQHVALKWMDTSADSATKALMATEARFLRALVGVPGIVQYHGSIPDKNHSSSHPLRGSFLVLDFCPGQDLTHAINNNPDGRLEEQRCRAIVAQLLCSLQAMHDRLIVHRDIKPGNVMVQQNNYHDKNDAVVTLVDLGICYQLQPGMKMKGKAGSEGYTAPEVWDESNPYYTQGYDCQADMYSVGCLVYTMLRGRVYQPPSSASSDEDTKWQEMSFAAKDFVRNLTHNNPSLRMTAEEAQHHPFVVGHGIIPSARMAKRWAEQFCTENATYLGIAIAFMVAAKFS